MKKIFYRQSAYFNDKASLFLLFVSYFLFLYCYIKFFRCAFHHLSGISLLQAAKYSS
jgi:hypothetical protein